MTKQELIEQITRKKEFSKLPKEDVEMVFDSFDKPHLTDPEKVKFTRDLLRKMYTAFISQKLLSPKNKPIEWILNRHISTKERLPHYEELYKKLVKKGDTIIDLGAGINALSYEYLPKNTKYLAVEAVGQLVELSNSYKKGIAIQESLFNIEKIKDIIQKQSPPITLFIFKTIDSLEMLKRNYSKNLLKEIVPMVDKVVVSFATKSLISKKAFKVKRYWFYNFVEEHFKILDEFELGTEKYIIFRKK
ncbi:hypothetical protein KAR91_84285 [Candidatus Pacearchaeota archaeon]|nr:hypothetical protein [Candidatus Pacearchaeota archaeon]